MKRHVSHVKRPTNSITMITCSLTLLALLCASWSQAATSASFQSAHSPQAFQLRAGPAMLASLGFTQSGNMSTSRNSHTATLLANGKVLVAGGRDDINRVVNKSAELYDPATGLWSRAKDMNVPRYNHTATLLPDGRVLVVGGSSTTSVISSLGTAELYNPASDTWESTSTALTNSRQEHTATLLRNGKVLVTGGIGGDSLVFNSELYDPATGQWRRTLNPMFGRRSQHTATLMQDGRVLVAGGFDVTRLADLESAEVYDPLMETWSSGGIMKVRHSRHTATLLPGGEVLVAGGDAGFIGIAETFNPADKSWTKTSDMSTSIDSHTATLLPNGKVLITGSDGFSTPQIYDPVTRGWAMSSAMKNTRLSHTATLLPSGQVLLVGGFGSGSATSELFDSSAPGWATIASTLVLARDLHTATLLANGKVLVAGGFFTNTSKLYDPVSKTFAPTANNLSVVRYGHTATLLQDGRVLVAGGVGPLKTAEVYDPLTNMWSGAGEMSKGRTEHTATLLPNGKVLVAGGAVTKDCELYDPATNGWQPTGMMSVERRTHTATLLANGKVLVAGGASISDHLRSAELYDPDTGRWTTNPFDMMTFRSVHRAVLLPSGKVLVAGGFGEVINNLKSAELYDPDTQRWEFTGELNIARAEFTATLLQNGSVLVAGGFGAGGPGRLKSAELYDPATGKWSSTTDLNTERYEHTATLLANGEVLVTGGITNNGDTGNAELFNIGQGFAPGWQPSLTSAAPLLGLNTNLTVGGARFRGVSEASGGNQFNSATNYPVLQLSALSNGQTKTIPASSSSDTSFTSVPVTGLPPGLAMVTLFTNGIPSNSQITQVVGATTAAVPIGSPVTVQSGPVTITFDNVSVEGTVTVTPINPAIAGMLPRGFDNNSIAFDITRTAATTGMITVCFKIPTVNDPTEFDKLKVFHNVNGMLVDQTISRDFPSRTVCAKTDSLSPFVIARRLSPPALTCPNNITVTAPPGQNSVVVNYPLPDFSNTGGAVVFASPPPGSAFPVGTTTVTITAATASGTFSCTFTVRVNPST